MTLVETVAAVVVLGIAIPPLVQLFTEVSEHGLDDGYQRMGLIHAETLMEEIVSKEFEDPDEPVGSFGTEESVRLDYDDMDDFDGYLSSPPKRMDGTLLDGLAGFTRSARVDNVTAADPDPATPAADGSTEFKRIQVSVSWTGGRGGEITLTTLCSKLVVPEVEGPLDVVASVATATRITTKLFTLNLVNITPGDLEIESFQLDADDLSYGAHRWKLEGDSFWHEHGGVSLPLGETFPNEGDASARTIPLASSPTLEYESHSPPSGTVAYVLTLQFTDGSSSTLPFSIHW